ncbi:Sucrase/ferredoxin-like-domain-containing protein [Mortierella sp. GBAus27b]|nr:hypothetical protein BGX31_001138 [Mortierella sp. GBA43]KAI8351351.1 Sucrase/ferredoxin-like-domain-containing protein [Mortierella sp. GBAus27b]
MIITLAIALCAVKDFATTLSEASPSTSDNPSQPQTLSQEQPQNVKDVKDPPTAHAPAPIQEKTTPVPLPAPADTPTPVSLPATTPIQQTLTPVSLPTPAPAPADGCSIPYISAADCSACPAPCADQEHDQYPSYLTIDFETPLLNSMKPYTRHVLISTGKEDWPAHIDEDKESLAPYLQKAIDDGQQRLREANGGQSVPSIMLTNSSRLSESWGGPGWQVIILPDHIVVDNVTPEQCDDFFEAFLKPAVGTVPHDEASVAESQTQTVEDWTVEKDHGNHHHSHFRATHADSWSPATKTLSKSVSSSSLSSTSSSSSSSSSLSSYTHAEAERPRTVTAGKTTFLVRKWQRRGAIMICSHKKRDKRCGVTAPYLRKAFKEHLLSKDMYGDGEDDVEIWLVSHIGGHKFAGNVIVHRREGTAVWYGRVSPCHAEHIIDVTVEKGQVIRELYRGSMIGSFDPSRKKMAW